MKFIVVMLTIMTGTLLLEKPDSDLFAGSAEESADANPKDSLNGIWETNDCTSTIKIFYFRQNKHPIVVYQSILDLETSTANLSAVEHTLTTFLGNCLFYYESRTQSLEYLMTYKNGELTINRSSEIIIFEQITEKDLTQTEFQTISNCQTDTLIMFQYRKPEVYTYYYCNDSSLRVKEDIFLNDSAWRK